MLKNIKTLESLAQYEIDAAFIIAQAISCISDKETRDKLSEIREEYEDNIKVITDILTAHGAEEPEHTRDFKGFFMQGYTGMRGLLSDQGTMRALSTNTQILINALENALKEEMEDNIKENLEKILQNTQLHLAYFKGKS